MSLSGHSSEMRLLDCILKNLYKIDLGAYFHKNGKYSEWHRATKNWKIT
jgi:hypothetical protein